MGPWNSNANGAGTPGQFTKLLLVNDVTTAIAFEDMPFEITFHENRIKIRRDKDNYAVVTLKNEQFSSKASILGGFALSEEKRGEINYARYFSIDWEDDMSVPKLYFQKAPQRINRIYNKGQSIELGLERISGYHVIYQDGVEAHFDRRDRGGFAFSFSTGFYGSFNKEPDESYTLTFKGDRLKPGEEDISAQSKFIITRSKYTGNLLLILQDRATVNLK